MLDHDVRLGLDGQARVYECWRGRLRGRRYVTREEVELCAMIAELAHVSVVQREAGGYRFRIAGGAICRAIGREARGLPLAGLPICEDRWAWNEALDEALDAMKAVVGRTRTPSGQIHFWMRLPMSSNGSDVDLVLCHDRYLDASALADLDAAARAADRRLRLDVPETEFAAA
jgi:hypothetical protein